MYLMYVDESGDSGLSRSPTKFFVLSGIVVHESMWRQFITDIIVLRRSLRTVYGFPLRAEIHSSELIQSKLFGLEKHRRLSILRNCLDYLSKLNYISVTNIAVDKNGKQAGYDPFNSAWLTLFQRFENTLTSGNFPGRRGADFGMVITDATAGKKLARLIRKMAVFNYVPHDPRFGGGARNVPIVRLIEDPHGKDSREALPIQMADIVAYFLKQRFAPNSFIRKKGAQKYFDRLGPVLNYKASRRNPLGIVVL